MSPVTQLLDRIEAGDPHAAEQLLPLVYDELRKLAADRLRHENPGQTLQATALVHEAYLRLLGGQRPSAAAAELQFANRAHFFSAAAEAMRRILIDRDRHKRRVKSGGGRARAEIDLDEMPAAPEDDLLAIDEALTRLTAIDPQAAELVKLRHFVGMTISEAAEVLGVSPRTADRIWAFARAWLLRELRGG
jgi:RNA polymerase sigma factor (TIGR02999 family)